MSNIRTLSIRFNPKTTMDCNECITVKDLLDMLNIKDFSCKKKIFKVNRALKEFYALTYHISDNWFYEPFGIGIQDIELPHNIYHIRGFFGRSSDCNQSCFIDLEKSCRCGSCDKCLTKQVIMHKGGYDLDNFQYSQPCGNKVRIRIDCGVEKGYFKYSRGPEKITNETDTICMNERMLVLFYAYMDYFYAKDGDEYNKMNVYDKKFQDMLKQVKELDTGHIIQIK